MSCASPCPDAGSDRLLDDLAARLGCYALAELHQQRWYRRLPQVLEKLEVEAYSLRAWNDAVSYIADRRLSFDAPQDARDFLVSFARNGQ